MPDTVAIRGNTFSGARLRFNIRRVSQRPARARALAMLVALREMGKVEFGRVHGRNISRWLGVFEFTSRGLTIAQVQALLDPEKENKN